MTGSLGPHLILDGTGGSKIQSLPEGIAKIGRSPLNTIQLDEPSVSRLHCFLSRQGDEVRLFDAGSENGTALGEGGAEGQLLADGDTFRVGRVTATYRSGALRLAQGVPVPDGTGTRRLLAGAGIAALAVAAIGLAFSGTPTSERAAEEPEPALSAEPEPEPMVAAAPLPAAPPPAPAEDARLAGRVAELEARLAVLAREREAPPAEPDRAAAELACRYAALEEEYRRATEESRRLLTRLAQTEESKRALEGDLSRALVRAQEAEAKGTAAGQRREAWPPLDAATLEAISKGADRLMDFQLANGAWSLDVNTVGDVGMTCAAAMALQEAWWVLERSRDGARCDRAILRAVRFVADAVRRTGSPGAWVSHLDQELGRGIHEVLALWLLARAYDTAEDREKRQLADALEKAAGFVRSRADRGFYAGDVEALAGLALGDLWRTEIGTEDSTPAEAPGIVAARPFPRLDASSPLSGERHLTILLATLTARSEDDRRDDLVRVRRVLCSVQDPGGSWTGYGCLESRNFCTSAAVWTLAAMGHQ